MRKLLAATILSLGVVLAASDGRAGFLRDIEEGFDEAFFGAFKTNRKPVEIEKAREAVKKEDFSEAMRLYETQIQSNDREALYETGKMYEENLGSQARALDEYDRMEQAAKRYAAASQLGHVDATYRYGRLLARGVGVQQDYILAAEMYRRAALWDHGLAQYEYGSMLGSGVGVPQDEYAALTWYTIAAQRNDVSPAEPAAEALCNRLRQQMDLALERRMMQEKPGTRFRAHYMKTAPVDGYEVMPARIWQAMERAVDFTPEGPTAHRKKPGLPTWRCFSGKPES